MLAKTIKFVGTLLLFTAVENWIYADSLNLPAGAQPPYLRLYAFENILKEKRILEKRYDFSLYSKSGFGKTPYLRYSEDEIIFGSIEDRVEERLFDRNKEITKGEMEDFLTSLINAGVRDLPESSSDDNEKKDEVWSEIFELFISETDIVQRNYWNRPEGAVRTRVNEIIFEFISRNELDQPKEPKDASISMEHDINSSLNLVLDEPLWNPDWFHGKRIERIEVDDEVEGIEQITLNVPNDSEHVTLKGLYKGSLWPIPEYKNKVIEYIYLPTRITITEGDHVTPVKLSMLDLLNNADIYHGRRVRLSGVFIDGFENQNFSDGKGHSLWLGGVSPFSDRETTRESGWATVDGIFKKGPSGHFGMWPGELIRVTRFKPHATFKSALIFFAFVVLLLSAIGILTVTRRRADYKKLENFKGHS